MSFCRNRNNRMDKFSKANFNVPNWVRGQYNGSLLCCFGMFLT